MCGIVGFSGIQNIELLRKMNAALIHRGPDEAGEFIDSDKDIALAMRRLSIIDLETGQQPMSNENQTIWLVCNGEIYNFQLLRQNLLSKGHKFKTHHSDTEVLIHLYEDKGFDMLKYLNGMFSFVIYDKNKNLFFGARDRVGIKPFYYVRKDKIFAFASELKALLLLKNVSKQIDSQSLYDYMSFQFVPSPRTIFKDIKKIPPAHYFVYQIGSKELKTYKYWDLPESTDKRLGLDKSINLVREATKKAILNWSVSDVGIACSLSGGIDSSSITGLLCSSGIKNLKTFSLGFGHKKERAFDERNFAKLTANRWGTDHHEIILEPDDLLSDLDKMVWSLDEPYGGGLPSWYIFKAMQGKVKVALTGTGGDELFGNYGKWRAYENIFSKIKQIAKFSILDNSIFKTLSMLKAFPQGYIYHRYFTENMKRDNLFNEDVLRKVSPSEGYIQNLWDQARERSPRDIIPYIDFKMQLPEEFLHMTDRFSMAHSIEARTPLLDHELIETAMKIPSNVRTNSKNLKYLFIKALKGTLSNEIINAPKKGFVLPIDRWLRGPLRDKLEYYLGANYLNKQGLFNQNIHSRILKPYLKGKKYLDSFIWTIFMFQLWHDSFVNNG